MTIEPLDMTVNSADFSEVTTARSPGLHLSQILSDLNEVRGSRYPETDPHTRQLYFATGFIWEQLIRRVVRETAIKAARGALVRPGEFILDGIAMSPDAIDTEDWAIEEYKSTYSSSERGIENGRFWHWIVQIKCYCWATGARTARLRVWFVNGDCHGSGPQAKAWTFHFTDRDVEEAFRMVRNHARAKGWL